jgi:hypothetical protein
VNSCQLPSTSGDHRKGFKTAPKIQETRSLPAHEIVHKAELSVRFLDGGGGCSERRFDPHRDNSTNNEMPQVELSSREKMRGKDIGGFAG